LGSLGAVNNAGSSGKVPFLGGLGGVDNAG